MSTKSWELQGDIDAALLPVRALAFPVLSKIESRQLSGCGAMVVVEHSAEALSALNRVVG